jgi:hypothetical protein
MPEQTQTAVNWALQQSFNVDGITITISKDCRIELIDKVREYFTTHNIECAPMSYTDLIPYLS